MNIENFVYWLSGALENIDPAEMDADKMERLLFSIKDHLALATIKVTPNRFSQEVEVEEIDFQTIPVATELDKVITKEEIDDWLKSLDDIKRQVKESEQKKDTVRIDPRKWPDLVDAYKGISPYIPKYDINPWPYQDYGPYEGIKVYC